MLDQAIAMEHADPARSVASDHERFVIGLGVTVGSGVAQHDGGGDEALAIDGKTLRGALDEDGVQAHIMSVVGHETKATLAQKKPA